MVSNFFYFGRIYRFILFGLFTISIQAQSPGTQNAGLHEVARPPGAPPPTDTVSVPPEDVNAVKACRDRILNTNPAVADRYSELTLNTICSRNALWQRTVANTSVDQSWRRVNFTEAQIAWFNSLHKCEDANCICEQSNACSSSGGNATSRLLKRTRSKRQRFPVDDGLANRAGRVVRREIRQMSDNDRWRYFRALNNLKNDFIDGMSKYDIMVMYHTPEYAPEAHFSAALFPFHREMMKNMELALRMYDTGVSIPYWDSTVDAPLPNPADSVIWTSDFFGNGFGDVTSGPFADWFVFRDAEVGTLSRSGRLMRNLGGQGSLMNDGDVNTILGKPRFRNLVFCIDSFTELAHGANHMWVGGHMSPLRTSPNDPTFYSLHAFMDLIWENWRWSHQAYNQRSNEYVFNNEACNGVSRFNSQMQPFQLSNGDGLSNRYTEVFYTYSDRPFCPDCGGTAYLFCDTRWNKCTSKIRQGGLCRGFEGFDACVRGQCVNGRCVNNGNNNNNNVAVVNNNPATTNCQNDHACCAQWSKAGECDRNQAWMRSNCRAACGVCTGGSCTDTSTNCADWASKGECQSNAIWMNVGCPVSCNTCNAQPALGTCDINTGAGGGTATAASTNTVQPVQLVQPVQRNANNNQCRNSDRRCGNWARHGQCESNPDWMMPNCAQACRAC